MQNDNPPSTPNPVPGNVNSAPASQQPPSDPSINPQNSNQTPIMVGSQLPPEKKSHKKTIIKFLLGLVILGAIFAVLVLTNLIPLSKFRTVTYDNGKGATFKLKFYSKHQIKNVSQSLPSTAGTGVSQDLKELASKTSVNGKAPLTLWISSSTNSSTLYANNDCTKNKLPKVFDARIDLINQSVPVCVIKANDQDLIYLVTFHDSKNSYLIFIAQDIDFQKALASQQNAKDILAKAGLKDYQDDLKTIIASVKPIN